MAEDTVGHQAGPRARRGSSTGGVSYQVKLPRNVQAKKLKSGGTGFYWVVPTSYKKAGCPWMSCCLGENLTQQELDTVARIQNERLDDWKKDRRKPRIAKVQSPEDHFRFGTVGWLLDYYVTSDSFLENVGETARPDYLRLFRRIANLRSKDSGVRYGDVRVREFAVQTAIAVYHHFRDAGTHRTAEKVVTYCDTAWKRMWPHFPQLFRHDVRNPWEGVTLRRREKRVKGFADRKTTYAFAWGAVENGRPELGAAAVLAYDFLMRPSSIAAGYARWSDYRSPEKPDKFTARHRKNGGQIDHPLEETIMIDGVPQWVLFYEEAEKILALVPRRHASIVTKRNGTLYGNSTLLTQAIHEMADQLEMAGFTLDKARHGGMTELEEAGLTEGQGMAISTHRSSAYRVYAKETEKRVRTATRKRFGYSEGDN